MKKYLVLLRPIAYFSLLLTFALAELSLIENTSLCFYRNSLGMLCAGCGVTRGFCAFMNFDFSLAAEYNPVFTYAIFPISIFLMLEDTVSIIVRLISGKKTSSLLEQAVKTLEYAFKRK